MRKFLIAVLGVLCCAGLMVFAACGGGGASSSGSSSQSTEPSGGGGNDTPDKTVSVTTSFENSGDELVFIGGNGTDLSLNTNEKYVRTGEKSLKIAVSKFANAEFSFSDNIEEKVVTDYEYLSFWVYSDFDGTLAVTNSAVYSAGKGSFIATGIEKGVWTKVKIDKNSEAFGIIKYNLAFNRFILMATGKDFGSAAEYDFYIDDVRLYKAGDKGECEIALTQGDEIVYEMAVAEAGQDYVLPKVCVFSPEGYRIAGADAACVKSVYDEGGNPIKVENGKINVDKCGIYTYECVYVYDEIENVFTARFEAAFAGISDFYVGSAAVGKEYAVVMPVLTKIGGTEVLTDVSCSVSVISPDGKEESVVDGSFTPLTEGEYVIKYEFSRNVGGTENKKVITKKLFAGAVAGLVNDFSGESTCGFKLGESAANMSLTLSGDRYKPAINGNKKSLKIGSSGNNTVSVSVSEEFPYKNADGKKYLSAWVYSGASVPVTMELTCVNAKYTLKSGEWNYCVFKSGDFIGDFAKSELLFYDEITRTKLSCDFYIDDVRLIGDGDAEEVVFADKVFSDEYDPATKKGIRYALNTRYEIDTRLYDAEGGLLTEKATVDAVKDKRNRNVTVVDGKYFTPKLAGRHTVTLSCEQNGILCTSEKVIDVGEQFLLSPDDKFLLLPGERGIAYTFDEMPVIWNHGEIDLTTIPEIIVFDPKGNEIAVTGGSFTPAVTGRYTAVFMVKDEDTRANALIECGVVVFENGKKGIIADFEDENVSMMESTTYYYGAVSDFGISEKRVHGGKYSAAFSSTSDDTRELKFGLTAGNFAGDISRSKYISLWVYVEDNNAENSYYIRKTQYGGWIDETDKSFVTGSLNLTLKTNGWTEIRVERKDYETVLGGVIFAGYTFSAGGSMWAAQNNDFITMFSVMNSDNGSIKKGVAVYIDDFVIGY